jgi:hypothetical protein
MAYETFQIGVDTVYTSFFSRVVTHIHEYTAYFRFPVEVETNLEGRTNISRPDNTLFIRGKARGFYIIRNTWRKRIPPVSFFADRELIHEIHGSDDDFYLLSDNIDNFVNDALGRDWTGNHLKRHHSP